MYKLKAELRGLMKAWLQLEVDERAVHEKAEEILGRVGWRDFPRSDERSILMEILSQLDILNHQLITVDDVPAILEFIDTPAGLEPKGWSRWQDYWESVDMKVRKGYLKGNPYYGV